MKYKFKLAVAVSLMLLASTAGTKTSFASDTYFPPLVFPLYLETNDTLLHEQGSQNLEQINVIAKYPSLTSKKFIWATEYTVNKSYTKPNSSDVLGQGFATSSIVINDGKQLQSNEVRITTHKDNAYLTFLLHRDHRVIGKQIEVPSSRLEEFGAKAGIIDQLDLVVYDSSSVQNRATRKVIAAYKKYPFYAPTILVDDGTISISNSTRYDYIVNETAMHSYYKELSETLTKEERAYTLLGVDGFESALKDKKYRSVLASYSHASIWLDKITLKPVYIHEQLAFREPVKKKQVYNLIQRTSFGKSGVKSQSSPKKFITVTEGAELLGFSLSPSLEEMFTYLEEQVKILDTLKTNEDKSIKASVIAYGYQSIGSTEKAEKYYTLASKFSDIESEKLVYLAKAKLAVGDGLEAKKYFEQAYKTDPDDYFVQFEYGDFLNGNSVASAPYKDIKFALELNEGWEDVLRDDGNLQSLYVNYILLKRFTDAKKLEKKFDTFDNDENLMAIARAYHQIGDIKMSKKYQDLALEKGYIWLPEDSAFFSLVFKKGKSQTK